MFELVADESSQKLGIQIHQKRLYSLTRPFLTGVVWHDSTTQDFSVHIAPNYEFLADIAEDSKAPKLKGRFDASRGETFSIGDYPTLDVIAETVTELEEWYRAALRKHGSNKHFLHEGGNGPHLVKDDKAADSSFAQAILQSRNIQAFQFLRDNKPLTHQTVVAKIMPLFLQAMGLKEYYVEHDTTKGHWNEVRFIIKEVGMFAFLQPLKPNDTAYFERYSYYNGDYHRSFSGETKGDLIKHFVFEWLADAAREQKTFHREEFEDQLDELTTDIRRTWIAAGKDPRPAIFERAPIIADSNVVRLGQFRQS